MKNLLFKSLLSLSVISFFFLSSCKMVKVEDYSLNARKLKPDTIFNEAILKFPKNMPIDTIEAKLNNLPDQGILSYEACNCNSNIYLLKYHDSVSINLEESLRNSRHSAKQEGEGYNFLINFPIIETTDITTYKNPFLSLIKKTTINQSPGTQIENKVVVALIDGGVDRNNSFNTNFIPALPVDTCLQQLNPDFSGLHATMINNILNDSYAEDIQLNIMDIKIFDSNGSGSLFNILCAIYFAVDNGADVINMSWGYYSPSGSQLLLDAFIYAKENNVVLVSSAGNNSQDNDQLLHFPSHYSSTDELGNMISVAAKKPLSSSLADYSNYGVTTVSIVAPGTVSIPWDNDRLYGEGTSFSAPYVTRIVSILKARNPTVSAEKIVDCILNNSLQSNNYPVKSKGGLNENNSLESCF